jgi:hypothetical protein
MDILAVHGVGSPPLGTILSEIAAREEICNPALYVRTDLLSDGQCFPCAIGEAHGTRIMEVNWGDLRRPMRTPFGIIRHLVLLMSAMLTVPLALCCDGAAGQKALGVYRAVFETIIFWAVLFPVITMLITTSPTKAIAAAFAGSGAAFLCILAFVFAKFSSWYKAGYVWSIAIVIVGTIAVGLREASFHFLTLISARIYVAAQVLLAALLSVCAFQLLFRRQGLTVEQRLGHLALLYFPFAILSGLGALLWSAALYPSKSLSHLFKQQRFESWGAVFLKGLHYDLRPVEWVFTLAIGLAGTLALSVALRYLLTARAETKSRNVRDVEHRGKAESGLRAQDGIGFLLYAMPIILAIASCYFVLDFLGYSSNAVAAWAGRFSFQHGAGASGTEVLDVYRTSALRVIPFLGFLVGPLTIVVDIMGDIVFFLADGAFSIRREAVHRVASGLRAIALSGSTPIIVCHSQGTVLVREALKGVTEGPLQLLSLGSPMESLYLRFLGWRPSGRTGASLHWINGYRTGDYIGGPIQAANRNVELGAGGHTGYWSDPCVWRIVTTLAGSATQRATQT